MTDEYLTTAEVAEVFKISPETVRHWRKVGTGPRALKVGHAVRYARNDVLAWLNQSNALATR